ncbi:hypothetical protein FOA52_008598 [Chlamydomonas sp. UWO 241]|nr:hypothetical protein FOA52_008598 [Chlamydomonas sp. UWO 241]
MGATETKVRRARGCRESVCVCDLCRECVETCTKQACPPGGRALGGRSRRRVACWCREYGTSIELRCCTRNAVTADAGPGSDTL